MMVVLHQQELAEIEDRSSPLQRLLLSPVSFSDPKQMQREKLPSPFPDQTEPDWISEESLAFGQPHTWEYRKNV